jgi:hypothetical protein
MSVWGMVETTEYEIEQETKRLQEAGESNSKVLRILKERLQKYHDYINESAAEWRNSRSDS